MVARETVLLGWADELQIVGDSGERVAVRFPAREYALLSNHAGNALFLVPCSKARAVSAPEGRRKGKRLHKSWSARGVEGAIRLTCPRGAEELHKVGYAESLLYTSDKWVSKPRAYVHEFTSSPVAYADRVRDPRVFGVLSTRGRTLVTYRGIVG